MRMSGYGHGQQILSKKFRNGDTCRRENAYAGRHAQMFSRRKVGEEGEGFLEIAQIAKSNYHVILNVVNDHNHIKYHKIIELFLLY